MVNWVIGLDLEEDDNFIFKMIADKLSGEFLHLEARAQRL